MNNSKHFGLGKSFLDSLSASELDNVTGDLAEVAIDALLNEGVLKDIPIVSTIIGLGKTALVVRDYLLLRKIAIFLNGIKNIPKEERVKFVNHIEQNPKYAEKVGESIVLLLDKYDHLDKAQLMAKIFCANVNGEISYDEFLKLSTSIERADLQDLLAILDYYQGKKEYRDISHSRRNLFNSNFSDFYVLEKEQQGLSGLEYPQIYHLNPNAEKFARIILGDKFIRK